MNTEQAIQEIAHAIGQDCLLEYPSDDALKIALAALRAQQERENPKPLTVEELKERHNRPVWIQEIEKPSESCWRLCYWDRGKYLVLLGISSAGHLIDEYGKTWTAYAHEPKEKGGQEG